MAKRGFGRLGYFKKSGARLYIPEKVLKDKNFPFKDGDLVKIEIGNDNLRVKPIEWWEMLDWKNTPEAFEKLPEEIKERVKQAGLV